MARKISKAWKTLLHYRSKKNLLHDSIWATCCVMSVKLKNSLFPLFLFLKFLPIGYQFYFWMVGNFFDPIVCNEKRSNLVSICLCLPRFVTNSVVSNRASLMTDISAKKNWGYKYKNWSCPLWYIWPRFLWAISSAV